MRMSHAPASRSLFFVTLTLAVVCSSALLAEAQSSSPTPPPDKRGIGVQSSAPSTTTQSTQQAREAKPELVLQSGYNNLFGATRLVFSPDGRLLATGTFRSSNIKLWETTTSRKLRELSTGTQGAIGVAPVIAFSRDNRYVAAAAGGNTVKVWEVVSGREVQSLAGPQGSMMASLGVSFIGFGANTQLLTSSDAIRIWDVTTGRELRTLETSMINLSSFNGADGGMALTPDGTQLVLLSEDSDADLRFIDISSGREVRRVKLPEDKTESLQLAFTADGHLWAAGSRDKHFRLWDLTAKANFELGPTAKEYSQVRFSHDGRLVSLSENYNVKIWETATRRELTTLKVPNSGAFLANGDAFASFSEDGKRIATGGFDTDVIIWDAETGKQLIR